MPRGLTDKQEKFVQALIIGKSQRESYKKAYPKCKATDKTVDEMASKLFNLHKVNARYKELHDRLVAEAEEESIISAKEVLREIKSIAFDDIKNYLDFRTEKTQVSEIEGEPVIAYAPIVDMKDSREIDTKNVAEVSIGANGAFKFKMYCRDTALYKLADILGLSKEQGGKAPDNGLTAAIRESAQEVWKDEISDIQPEAVENTDVVGESANSK